MKYHHSMGVSCGASSSGSDTSGPDETGVTVAVGVGKGVSVGSVVLVAVAVGGGVGGAAVAVGVTAAGTKVAVDSAVPEQPVANPKMTATRNGRTKNLMAVRAGAASKSAFGIINCKTRPGFSITPIISLDLHQFVIPAKAGIQEVSANGGIQVARMDGFPPSRE